MNIDRFVARNPGIAPPELPERFADAKLEHLPQGLLRNTVLRYLGAENLRTNIENGIGCLFIGKAGVYKTYAAAVLAKEIHERLKLPVVFVQCPVFMGQCERNRFADSTEKRIRGLYHAPVVVMDDFSQIATGSFGAGLLLEIAESRFSNLCPTIWTGNINVPEVSAESLIQGISTQYGTSFGRRVVETSKGYGAVIR